VTRSAGRLAAPALMLLPGAVVVFTGFNAGGFFPDTPAFVAIVLLQILIARVLLADRPFEGFNRELLVASALLGLYALWTLASALWSDAPARALLEFDRALFYLVALVLFGSIGASRERLRWLVWGLAAGFCAICLPALISRALPNVWETSPNISNNRLSYPVTYWNALGIIAGIGLLLCLYLACRARGSVAARLLGAAAVPALAATLYFTFSRGAIVATIAGGLVFAAVARPRGLMSGLLATAPMTAIAVAVAYGADVLATPDPTSPAGVEEGHRVATVVALCMAGAAGLRLAGLRLDRRMVRYERLPADPRRTRLAAGGAGLAAVLVFLVAGGPGWVGDQYDRFAKGPGTTPTADLRQRLTDVGNNGRIEHWRVARIGFDDNALRGSGAGTYQLQWERERRQTFAVTDAHGLYFEVMGELGIVGLALLLGAILTILAGLARRARGDYRPIYGALLAAGVAWALHAGVDWDWEMPATTFWFFVAAPHRREGAGPVDGSWRAPLAILLAAAAVTPVLVTISQNRIQTAADSFAEGDCPRVISKSLDAAEVLAARPEPYAMVGYCQVRRGFGQQGVSAMEKAVDHDPDNWEYRYGLAVARGAAGLDPRPAAGRALALNPREPIVRDAQKRFARARPADWPRAAEQARRNIYASGLISLP
jgi:O-antigen ligase